MARPSDHLDEEKHRQITWLQWMGAPVWAQVEKLEQLGRKEAWIRHHGVTLVQTYKCCEHVLQRLRCPPKTRYRRCEERDHMATDHAQCWQRPDGTRFLLAHVYDFPERAIANAWHWAEPRGLVVVSDPADGWYGYGTVPLRYELADGGAR